MWHRDEWTDGSVGQPTLSVCLSIGAWRVHVRVHVSVCVNIRVEETAPAFPSVSCKETLVEAQRSGRSQG